MIKILFIVLLVIFVAENLYLLFRKTRIDGTLFISEREKLQYVEYYIPFEEIAKKSLVRIKPKKLE